ncbi:hypothetical protein [Reyranella sp.]|uniref:hypothetical protein n=1 Tax=Reyranella sp. TaxID=1929291 RepID=UPI003BAC9CAA
MNVESEPSAEGSRARPSLIGQLAFVGGFAAVLAFFGLVDFYDAHFFETGYSALYNALRVVFAGYFFWLLAYVGQVFLGAAAGRATVAGIPLHERLALGFFAGAAVVTVVMLAAGYLGLYWRWIAVAAALPVMALSCRDFVAACGEARTSIGRFLRESSTAEAILAAAMVVLVFVCGAALLLVKGLYPQGGHDYYQHYSQFYTLVVERHDIWLNDFWYQYYYSKGLGVTFLGMLLSDALAPSLVAFCFACAGALALFSLVDRFCSRTVWPWVAVALYLALDVHTLGTGFYAANGGWGHFQKPHELNAPLLLGILWMSVGMVRATGLERRAWWAAAAACAVIAPYLLVISAAIVGLFAVVATVVFFFLDRASARSFFGLAVAAGCGLASVLVLNYVTTSIPSDIGLEIWWPIIDFHALDKAGILYDIVNAAYRRTDAVARGVSFRGFDMLDFVRNASRLDILATFAWGGLAGLAAWLVGRAVLRRRATADATAADASNRVAGALVLAFVASIGAVTITVGASEPVSYVRASSFMLPLTIALAAIAWQFALAGADWRGVGRIVLGAVVPVALAAVTLVQAYESQKKTLTVVMATAIRFADGRYSIFDAYRDQSGWPALPDSTAIYPGMHEAWKSIGPGRRLWTFNVHTYCMLPGCRAESHISSRLSPRRTEILYGSPEVARKVLQEEGLHYFFIATRRDIRDPMICTPLFSPDTIRDYLGVKWSDGTDALLTWKGPGIAPLSQEWVDKYRKALKDSPNTPDCSGEGPAFSHVGRRIHDEVVKGKRWGHDIERPK